MAAMGRARRRLQSELLVEDGPCNCRACSLRSAVCQCAGTSPPAAMARKYPPSGTADVGQGRGDGDGLDERLLRCTSTVRLGAGKLRRDESRPTSWTVAKLKGGDVMSGLVTSQNSDEVEFLLPTGLHKTVKRAEIVMSRIEDRSPMPDALIQTAEDMRDLLAYLVSVKK